MNDPLDAVPPPSARRVAVHVTAAAARLLRDGSPWVYADGVARTSFPGAAGDLAVAFDAKERFLGVGLWDPFGAIRFRALTAAPETVDMEFFRGRVRAAAARRAGVAERNTGYRVVYGEADGLGGLVVDRYEDVLVVKIYTAAWIPHLRPVVEMLVVLFKPRAIVLRLNRSVRERPKALHGLAEGVALHGRTPDAPVIFTENGHRFAVDVVRGQKTGFFLDQRDNRLRVGRLSRGREVLNVCSYTGGFTVYAMRGGATSTASLDISGPALDATAANVDLNDVRDRKGFGATFELIQGDAFRMLPALALQGRRFDLVVLDPPSFAKKSTEVPRALDAYRRLARHGVALLREGGILVACSCSSRVAPEAFFEATHAGARDAGRVLRERDRTFHPEDHPAPRPEFAYLKALFADVAAP